MDEADIAIRRATYKAFVDLGRAPTTAEVGAATGTPQAEVRDAWRHLHDAHALVLDLATGTLRMANPFSAVPTAFRVEAAGRSWYANCAWDAFGIGAALHVDSRFETTCPDCADPISITVRDRHPDDTSPLWHCLVPAAQWWNDIGFT